ncbi:MAG: hypothetical protein JOY90_35180 [Bradyrhizobium sp.]|uniref:hypothetical protein n=1 Tax=Bradyrhizobium sp. TaxID=376 RepID=UPI001DDFB95D|nr:hypothetical protein [Bradyrhizobium sp.]MBV9565659.1 hypothetical protein [Bradyrhizobium sp.]
MIRFAPLFGTLAFCTAMMTGFAALADDQTQMGAGNARAEEIGAASPLVQSAVELLRNNAQAIQDAGLRDATLDSFLNDKSCVHHRANLTDALKDKIIAALEAQHLLNLDDAASITGGVKAGIFPPVNDDGAACPTLPLTFKAAAGSVFGGHHSYPGGLAVHESFNVQSSINLAATYRGEYGSLGEHDLPVAKGAQPNGDVAIDNDVILAAPIWHDWAKRMVFQWNRDGSEFIELNFGGTGHNDNAGAAGDSRTGGHHILGIAETMARGLSPLLVITQASAHAAPTLGNEFKVVNWLRAAAIVAQIDPIEKGYLVTDNGGHFRLPPLATLGDGVNLTASDQSNVLVEYQIHNLSDADFVNSIAAVTQVQILLQRLAPRFGYDVADATRYNNNFRNVVLAYLSPERLMMIYGKKGLEAVAEEVDKLKRLNLI